MYIVFETKSWPYNNGNNFTLRNSLFGGVKLTKNPDPDKYSYPGYGILCDATGPFSLSSGGFIKNAVIIGADMRSYVHVDDNKKISSFLLKVQRKG